MPSRACAPTTFAGGDKPVPLRVISWLALARRILVTIAHRGKSGAGRELVESEGCGQPAVGGGTRLDQRCQMAAIARALGLHTSTEKPHHQGGKQEKRQAPPHGGLTPSWRGATCASASQTVKFEGRAAKRQAAVPG